MAVTEAISEGRRLLLWAEFLALFVAVPLVIAVALPPSAMFSALFAATVVGVILLHWTRGFRWSDLSAGGIDWRAVGAFSAVTFVCALGVALATTPGGDVLAFARNQWPLLIMIVVLYPVLSALPQELVFRPLFFRRYCAILPGGWAGIVLNAALFSFAHLMYWSAIVAGMTFFGGLAFAWAYARRGSFPMAVVMHALAGQIVFALGLGLFFYSGNVVRPF
jgi:uncharacterized protein